jgi:hypothetical protein
MENGHSETKVPFIVYENERARQERDIKRMIILCCILAAGIVVNNALWIFHFLH